MKKSALLMAPLAALLVALAVGTASADRSADPRFAPPKSYDNPGRGQPQNVVKGDFDEDGVLDLAMSVADAPDNAVSLFRGRPNGTFAEPPRRFDAAEDAAHVVKSDFNDDGHLDLAVSDFGAAPDAPGSVAILFGTGEGTFEGRRSFPSGGKQPNGLAAPDVDGDGDKDLAVANSLSGAPNALAGNVTVLLNNGNGMFEARQSIEPPSPPSSRVGPVFLAAGDLDGDGDPDLAATVAIATQAGETGNVLVLENEEGRYVPGQSVAVGAEPQQIVLGLFDGDRRPDFATANAGPNNVSVGLGNGDGTFGRARELPSGGVGPTSLLARDLNKDGKEDLAVSNIGAGPGGGGNVGVLTGRGDGTFKKPETFRAGNGPAGLTAGRFDRDGRPDLAVADVFSNKLSVLKNTTPKRDPRPDPEPDDECTIMGNNRDNVLRGTDKRDVICAHGGDDTIKGMGGNDLILGGAGKDTAQGDNGGDTIKGQDGNDTLQGNDGRDRLYGNEGDDTIEGGSGRDVVRGGPGRDVTQQ